ncbi:MAG TPA: hypothetical protein VM240_00735 [Verrucomicrobiae bacterium]|nr:hypothetical protein [Verrucomicrobiae bacterium]
MSELLVRAELVKLARALGTEPAEVDFLAGLDVAALRQLEDRITQSLFDEHRVAFQRLADASKLLPASLIAKMSERVFGPMLSARVSGVMDPQRAVEIAGGLKTAFLADVCVQMDPRSASTLLQRMPVKIIVEVAQVLLKRKDYVTMGRFVDELTDEAIRAVMEKISDDHALVRVAGYVERRQRVAELIDLVPLERLKRVVAAIAAGPTEVQDAGLLMMGQLTTAQQGRVGDIAIELGAGTVQKLRAIASRAGATELLREVLPRA